MRSRIVFGMIMAAAIVVVIVGIGMQLVLRLTYDVRWEPRMVGYHEPGNMGIYSYIIGPWMMGRDMMVGYGYAGGSWVVGPQWSKWSNSQTALHLSADDVKNAFGSWLAWQGNPHLKLGKVSEEDVDTIIVDIVTTDKDGLVQRYAVNRHTGISQPSGG